MNILSPVVNFREPYLPTHVVVCQDCGCIKYGSIFVKAIRCQVCGGRNKLACRLREELGR